MKKKPIGIFDSGIGGLTIAHAIKQKLTNEDIIYFGDTKHLPYGEKSESAIQEFSIKISNFLINKNCKAIIIACNSASSVAYDHVKNISGNILGRDLYPLTKCNFLWILFQAMRSPSPEKLIF